MGFLRGLVRSLSRPKFASGSDVSAKKIAGGLVLDLICHLIFTWPRSDLM